MTLLYCLELESPAAWKVTFLYLCPLGTGSPSYTTGIGFSRTQSRDSMHIYVYL
jgi:hypothetical protein